MRMIGFIVNPVSGNGRGAKVWKRLQDTLDSRQIAYSVRYTSGPLEARTFAREWAEDPGIRAVVAVGGDGTLHETANGLHDGGGQTPLGYIPSGSGNDFARGMGLPSDPLAALDVVLNAPRLRRIDLIRSHERISVGAAGAGFDATVALATNTSRYKEWLNKFRLGKLAYVFTMIHKLIRFRPAKVTITVDGEAHVFDRVLLITVANHPYFGGGMKICPDAVPDDGEAEICIVGNLAKTELLAVFPRVYKGTHTTHPAVRFLKGKRIRIESNLPLDAHMEGESAGTTPMELEVVPAALPVIVREE
jgi:YegS/Rv2252/BmrU family lipid kinase